MDGEAFKTLRARVWLPTRIKGQRLCWLHDRWGATGYKMHDNMAVRYPTKRVLNQWAFNLRENPASALARWWIRLPITRGEWRNYPLRMAPEHEDLLAAPDIHVCNSELIRKGRAFYIHLTIKKPVQQAFAPRDRVLAVDLGERNVATSVIVETGSSFREPRFHARAVRGVRRHYGWLRRRLQELGHFRTMSRVRHTERRKVDALLHQAARAIVDQALRERAALAVGDLKGLRARTPKGRSPSGKRFARRVHSMPYGRLTTLIHYKARWAGVPVLLVDERYTSKRCYRCHTDGTRPCQGLFRCPSCGWEGNADLNGAANIGKRALEYISEAGAPGSEPEGGQPDFTRDRPICSLERPRVLSVPSAIWI